MRQGLDFNSGWRFCCGDEPGDQPLSGDRLVQVTVPHCWDTEGRFCWAVYKKAFMPNLEWQGKELYLTFAGIASGAQVYFNDRLVGQQVSGFAPLCVRLTGLVRWTRENTLIVKLSADSLQPPEPNAVCFAGIYGDVQLHVYPAAHFSPLYGVDGLSVNPQLLPDGSARIRVRAAISGHENAFVRFTLLRPDGTPCRQKAAQADSFVEAELDIPDPQLWSGQKAPVLYALRAQLMRSNACADEVRIPFGLHDAFADLKSATERQGIAANLRGICRYGDHPSMGCALDAAIVNGDIEALLTAGANALLEMDGRIDHALLSRCDQEGLMVWAQLPQGQVQAQETLDAWADQYHIHPSLCAIVVPEGITVTMPGDIWPLLHRKSDQLCSADSRPLVFIIPAGGSLPEGSAFVSSLSGYCASDAGQQNALLSHTRKEAADAYYMLMASWTETPVVRIATPESSITEDKRIQLRVFSNASSLSISVNGKEMGRVAGKKPEYTVSGLTLVRGDNTIIASSPEGAQDTILLTREKTSILSRWRAQSGRHAQL